MIYLSVGESGKPIVKPKWKDGWLVLNQAPYPLGTKVLRWNSHCSKGGQGVSEVAVIAHPGNRTQDYWVRRLRRIPWATGSPPQKKMKGKEWKNNIHMVLFPAQLLSYCGEWIAKWLTWKSCPNIHLHFQQTEAAVVDGFPRLCGTWIRFHPCTVSDTFGNTT